MRTLFLDCSAKKKRSTSSYLAWHLKVSVDGEKIRRKLLLREYPAILAELEQVDRLVLSMPMYVDGIPSNVLHFMQAVEEANIRREKPLRVYVISNCGFWEGRQNKNVLAMAANWCARCGFDYMGGLGVGAGEMLGIVRYFNVILALLIGGVQMLVNAIIQLTRGGFDPIEMLKSVSVINLAINILLIFVFSSLMYVEMGRLARAVRKGRKVENRYTTVLCPRFLFVIFADLFWIIRAMFKRVPFWRLYARPAENE